MTTPQPDSPATVWKPHPKYNKIECSSDGVVRNRFTGKVYATHLRKNGYFTTAFVCDGKSPLGDFVTALRAAALAKAEGRGE